ncbi:MAG TPA: antibiotic biosynthesis monooxygenase [Thermoleophilaceae bacterium]|nr:antibiotic biosynthesis monooxygenase [Thermoleophilaceae bacterium]
MHARVSTLQLEAAKIDDVVSQLQERDVPEWEQMDGFKGFTLMADRQSGKTVGVSFWESADAMTASEENIKESRRRAAETGGASGEPTVDRFEVLIDTMA